MKICCCSLAGTPSCTPSCTNHPNHDPNIHTSVLLSSNTVTLPPLPTEDTADLKKEVSKLRKTLKEVTARCESLIRESGCKHEAVLRFDLSDFDAKAEFKRTMKATDCYGAFWDINNSVWRPARKHSYSGDRNRDELQKLLESGPTVTVDGEEVGLGYEIIDHLQKIYYEILEEHGISMEDYN